MVQFIVIRHINLLTRKLSSYPLIKKAIENLKLSKHGMNKLSSIWVKYWSDNKWSTNQLTHVGKPFAPNPHPSLKIFFKGDPINPVFDFPTYRLKTIHIGKQFTPTPILLSKSFS